MLQVAVEQVFYAGRLHAPAHVCGSVCYNLFGHSDVVRTRFSMWNIVENLRPQLRADFDDKGMAVRIQHFGEGQVKTSACLWPCLHRGTETGSASLPAV